ncbi:MAG: peptidoglycan D,D-transpeptidase FtsI family protein [Anaerolineae bacterium]|jgi:cell division protein FtsI/penicillin-binding protein 2
MSSDKAPTTGHHRLNVLAFCLTFACAVLVGQLFRYQVIDHDELRQDALNQRTWEKEVSTDRGFVADANGHILALDTIEWKVSASPPLVIHPDEIAGRFAELLGLPRDEVYAKLTSEGPWVQLAAGVDYEAGEEILALDEPGITCLPEHRRFYPEGELFAHVIGIVNNTGDGFYGVEGYHNQMLRGDAGYRRVEQNPVGQELPFSPLEAEAPEPGTSLILTIDRNIQYIAEQELLKGLDEYGAESGTVLIMDPQSGSILALVSQPSYDPNDFAEAELRLLPDPTVSKMWEPGSIFKIITWAAGLDSGTISPGTTFYDDGALEVGGRVIRNWDRQGHGLVTMQDGLVQSLNTVAAFISTSTGKDQFYTYLRRFGFGTLTQVDLASEGPGMMKLPGDSNWFPSELGTNSFGQGVAVTPMQMIVAASAVANKGMLMKPHIVGEMITKNREGTVRRIRVDPMMVRWAISQETAQTMTQMLVQVVEKGATQAQIPGYRVAGKTGTAQIPTPYGYHPSDTIGSFVGYVPADDPQFIVLVKLDKPTASPWGSQTAAPTFRAIAERLLVYMQIPPDEIRLAASQ